MWWPPFDDLVYPVEKPPVWDVDRQAYVDPKTKEALPTWGEALDALEEPDSRPATSPASASPAAVSSSPDSGPGKTLADHRADNRAWIRAVLAGGMADTDEHDQAVDEADGPKRYRFELARPEDPDVPPPEHRLLRAVSARIRLRTDLDTARLRSAGAVPATAQPNGTVTLPAAARSVRRSSASRHGRWPRTARRALLARKIKES